MVAETQLVFQRNVDDHSVQQLEEAPHDRLGHGARIATVPRTTTPGEKTPLVLKPDNDAAVGIADGIATTSEIVRDEAHGVIRLAVPFAGAQVVQVLPAILFGVLLGNVAGVASASILAASALADFFSAQVVYNLAGGMASALETVCAQSFGAKQFAQLCLYAQAGLLAAAYCMPIVALLSLHGATLFTLLGQDPHLAQLAAVFTSINVLSLPFVYVSAVAGSVVMSQHIVAPFVWIPIVANAVALPTAYVLGYYTPLGYVGVLLAMVAANVIKFLLTVPLVAKSPAFAAEHWPGFQWREAHALLKRLVPLGASSILMVTFQALGVNCVSLLCGYLPNVAQSMAANTIAGSLFSLAVMPVVGVFASGCIRVGTALGAGNARRAEIAGYVGAATTITVALGTAVASVCIANGFAHSYTQDQATAAATVSLYYRLVPTVPLFAWMLGAQGVLRACGKQWLIAQLSFACLFVVGVPVGLWLAITCELGVEGLWYGQMVGIFGCSIITTVIVARLDWEEVAREAYRNTHVHVDHEPEQEP